MVFVVLRIGQKVPEFSLPDTQGRERSLAELIRDAGALLVFFPFAFSGVCDKEMCAFRDMLSGPSASGARVVGISVDSLFALRAFSRTYDLPFLLLSDFNKKVSKLYGVLQERWVGYGYGGVANRSVFLVDRKGVLRYRWMSDVPSNEPPYVEVVRASAKLRG